jgi:hypothetical protein
MFGSKKRRKIDKTVLQVRRNTYASDKAIMIMLLFSHELAKPRSDSAAGKLSFLLLRINQVIYPTQIIIEQLLLVQSFPKYLSCVFYINLVVSFIRMICNWVSRKVLVVVQLSLLFKKLLNISLIEVVLFMLLLLMPLRHLIGLIMGCCFVNSKTEMFLLA